MDVQYAATLIRSWISRRKAKGIAVQADAIWDRINDKWPHAEVALRERVFQAAGRP